ncbi:MAG: hypothetical protein H5T86_06530 [Armatimonadetes bacterium]|nr:hypothetical protein [Armatimonadota bacterium]
MRTDKLSVISAAAIVLWAFIIGLGTPPAPVSALDLGGGLKDLIKLFGIGWVVSHFGDDIDKFINRILGQHEAQVEGLTKVVPIVRVGKGDTAVGAVQVMGPEVQVKKVQAVAEVEVGLGRLTGRGLIPITTKSAETKTVRGVGGVGVSANIKFPL